MPTMCDLRNIGIIGDYNDEQGVWVFGAECSLCDWEGGETINAQLAIMDAQRHAAETSTGPETDLPDGEAFEPTSAQLDTLKALRTVHPDVEVVKIMQASVRVRLPLEGMAREQWITADGGQRFCGDGSLPDGP
jgi:hypothetical protein